MMKAVTRAGAIGVVAVLGFAVLSGSALAVPPKKNATFVWTGIEKTKLGSKLFKVELHVGFDGTKGTADWYCGKNAKSLVLASPPVTVLTISATGALNGQYPSAGIGFWGLKGTFTTAKAAKVVLRTGIDNSCTEAAGTYSLVLKA